MNKVAIVILAAGDGKRMKTGIPKVMNELKGKPLVGHVVEAVEHTGLVDKPVVVVCANHTLVQDYVGERAMYVVQEKQLGTGHAVGVAEPLLKGKADTIVVLYGDMPFIRPASIQKLVREHAASQNVLTLMTVTVPDFADWRTQFNDFGRIIRDTSGHIVNVVEKKDATSEQLTITEVNPSYICFSASWLWNNLYKVSNSNAQGEYYLIDLIKIAFEQGDTVGTVAIDPKEAVGINTKEHLDIAAGM